MDLVGVLIYVLLIYWSSLDGNAQSEWKPVYEYAFASQEDCIEEYHDFHETNKVILGRHLEQGHILQAGCIEVYQPNALDVE